MNISLLKNWSSILGFITLASIITFSSCEKTEREYLENNPHVEEPTYTETQEITEAVLTPTTLTDIHDDPNLVDYRVTLGTWNIEAQLEIDRGVVIEFVKGAKVIVKEYGSMRSSIYGTEDVKLTCEEKTTGSWVGIIGHPNSTIYFAHSIIEYAGGPLSNSDNTASAIRSEGSITVNNSLIKNSGGYGIRSFNDGLFGRIIDNRFIDNTKAAISTTVDHLHTVSQQFLFTGNGHNGVQIRSSVFENGPCPEPWETLTRNGSGSYLIENDDPTDPAKLLVETNLQIFPGVTIKFGEGAELKVDADLGMITAMGTSDDPIVFMGRNGQKGAWKGIFIEHSLETSYMDHVIIKHGGSEVFDAQLLPVKGNIGVHNAKLVISNSTISDSGGCAFATLSTNDIEETNNVYVNNNSGQYCGN